MSNTTAVDPYIAILTITQLNISRYTYSILVLLGNIGCVLSILIFIQPNYRRNSCTSYILANTFTNLIIINLFFILRFLVDSNIDLIKTSSFCKFQVYILQAGSAISRIYIVLACIDRWALTSRSVRRQAFAQMKVVKILIPSVPIIWCVTTIHVALYQNVVKGQCVSISKSYLMFYNIYNMILTGLVIPSSMIVFSLLCIQNVKQLQQRVHAHPQIPNVIYINQENAHQSIVNRKNYDYQLLFMVLVQQCIYLITNLPFISFLFYSTITLNWNKTSVQLTIDGFYRNIIQILVYVGFSLPFYIYIFTGSIFRKDLKRLLFHNHLMKTIFGTRQNA